ncbi:DUF4124 domain-containing protein [Methylomonas sp. AM2-LC]|uniref:DUF4124 domain-containing protein n=1 Tax=Methylomonas sp. AM2-LC TaxID=3153301 RepID=UPI003267C0DC
MAANIKKVMFISLALLLTWQTALAKKMYKLVDEDGNVYYSDHVLVEQVKLHREILNEKAGVVEVLEKAKNPEQLKMQKKLELLRQEQDKIIAKQAANDKNLLSSFHSVEEIQNAMVNKLGTLDVQQKAIESNVQRFTQQLAQQHQTAAEFERNNQKVPDKLLAEIESSKKLLADTEQELKQHIRNRQNTEQSFKADMERYKFLVQIAKSKVVDKKQDENNITSDLGLYVCKNTMQCEQAWKIAGVFVARYSTTPADVENESLIMRASPVKDDDLSLSVSKLNQIEGQMQIFLDVRCRNSSLGKELCSSHQVQSIREEFSPFIQSMLAPH